MKHPGKGRRRKVAPPPRKPSLALTLADFSRTVLALLAMLFELMWLLCQPKVALAAELLAARKELGRLRERDLKLPRPSHPLRACLALLSRLFEWRGKITLVRAQTVVVWQRMGWKLYWRWRSRRGRPPLDRFLRRLIRRMARDNPTWGQHRIAAELLLKCGLLVSPRTVSKYMPRESGRGPGRVVSDQRWMTFIRNHAKETIACDFMTVVETTLLGFRTFYVFVLMEVGSRKILHTNVTTNPTAEWTTQQLRQAILAEHPYRFLVHDRDAIFSARLDKVVSHMGIEVLTTPPRAPQANAFCERLIGTLRRECFNFFIVRSEVHLRRILKEYVAYYNRARPHMSLGSQAPVPVAPPVPQTEHRHRLPEGYTVKATPILGGLHHDYHLEKIAA